MPTKTTTNGNTTNSLTVWGPYITTLLVTVIITGGWVATEYLKHKDTPVTPIGPSTGDLAFLVPEAESRDKLAQYFGDFATVIEDPNCPLQNTAQFRSAYRLSVPLMQSAGRLPNVQSIDEPINQRFQVALGGLEVRPLDETTRKLLVGTLNQIAFEFKGG